MNKFFVDNFNISKIKLCVLVSGSAHQVIHKNRPNHGLVFQLKGKIKYKFDDGTEMLVRAGDVFYLPKASNYEVMRIEAGECIAVNFDLYNKEQTYEPFFFTSSQYEKYEKSFNIILNNWNMKKNGYLNNCFAALYSIICHIQQEASKVYTPSPAKKLVYDAVEYIQKNISDCSLTVQKVSEQSGVSPEYFRKLFKGVYNTSPRKYIIELRIKKAKDLILSKEFNMKDISEMCGFESESYFSTEFKRICGCVPTAYGKNING